jgi:hypothetical protein
MNLSEWIEKNRKTFTLKSGLTVTIRRLSPFAMEDDGSIPGIDSISPNRQSAITRSILKQGLISPKIGEGEGELHDIMDLGVDDVNEIVTAIVGEIKGGNAEGIPLASTVSGEQQPS